MPPKASSPSTTSLLPKVGLRDVLVGGGIALTAIGAGLVYFPAGIIVPGVILLYLGIVGVPAWR